MRPAASRTASKNSTPNIGRCSSYQFAALSKSANVARVNLT